MAEYQIPFGKSVLTFQLPDELQIEWIAPSQTSAHPDPQKTVQDALAKPVGNITLEDFKGLRNAAIAINDKTRPVPHQHLLPPLLAKLEALGFSTENIFLVIATGTHPVMPEIEYDKILPKEIYTRYPIICHNARQQESLVYLGQTRRNTPVWINRAYAQADLKIVVGNIEPHQFQGFSGGYKSAAIGLAGLETINTNHAMMQHVDARLGEYKSNPARQDIEEMGKMIGVQFALNAILNEKKEIVEVLAGDPVSVMQAGIPLSRKICQVAVHAPFQLVIASPGGYPKDLNIYQSQKGLAHARMVTVDGGTIILAAECSEGSGSRGYEEWMRDKKSYTQILNAFAHEGFRTGPHKGFQIARDASQINLQWYSGLEPEFAERLLLNPVADFQNAISQAVQQLPPGARIGIMPRAASTIPYLQHPDRNET